jgi:NTP pyrophosphatase (non-canonical NTP hydrolase)
MRDLNEYQHAALATMARDKDELTTLATLALGIAGEAGEVADLVKKQIGHGHPADPDKIAKELGDVLWYVACLADAYGFYLSKIARLNIDKLEERYPDGFTTERSIHRA